MTVSYLITLYNKQNYIGEVLDSVFAEQATAGGEIVIYNDASTDGSMDIVRARIAARPSQADSVEIMEGGVNRGLNHATNRLVEKASCPYIRLVDADDILVRGSTAGLLRLLKQGNFDLVYGLSKPAGSDIGLQSYKDCYQLHDPLKATLRNVPAAPTASLFVAPRLKEICPLPENIRHSQDLRIGLRMAADFRRRIGHAAEIVALSPAKRDSSNLSSRMAEMFADCCRIVMEEEVRLPLPYLRYACGRYAGRVLLYYRRAGSHKLTPPERAELLYCRWLSRFFPPAQCRIHLRKIAAIFDRDRDVVLGG